MAANHPTIVNIPGNSPTFFERLSDHGELLEIYEHGIDVLLPNSVVRAIGTRALSGRSFAVIVLGNAVVMAVVGGTYYPTMPENALQELNVYIDSVVDLVIAQSQNYPDEFPMSTTSWGIFDLAEHLGPQPLPLTRRVRDRLSAAGYPTMATFYRPTGVPSPVEVVCLINGQTGQPELYYNDMRLWPPHQSSAAVQVFGL